MGGTLNQPVEPDFEKGIEILNSILFCSHLDKLPKEKEKMEAFLSELKEGLKQAPAHKERIIEFIQDILMAYHEKEKSLDLKRREIAIQRLIKWLAIVLILLVLGVAGLIFHSFQKKSKENVFSDNGNYTLDLPLNDRLNLLEDKAQKLMRDNDKILILLQNFKTDLEKSESRFQILLKEKEETQNLRKDYEKHISKNKDEMFKMNERMIYVEDLIREMRAQRIFSK